MKSGMAKGERIALGEVAEINPQIPRAAVDDPGMEVSFVGMSGVSEVTASVLEHDVRTVAECRKGYTAFQRGDVLVAKITPCFENGKIVMADIPHAFGFGSTEFHVIRPRPDKLDPRFLLHFLRVPFFRVQGERRMTGSAGQRRVPANFLSTFDIPLPPLLLQRRIAEVLDKAEALRAKRRAALAQLDSLTQSLFLDLFGDPAKNPKGFKIGRIGDLLESASYGTSEKSGPHGEYAVLRMNNITRSGEMDFADLKFMDLEDGQHDRYLARDGDVLFNRTNSAELVGKTGIIRGTKPMAYAGYLIRLRVNAANDPEFLWGFLNSKYSKLMLRGMCKSIIGMANINATEIQAMKIPLPPLDLQHEFARRVTAVEKLKTAQRAALAELDALFASLQHRAFRGEL